MTYVSEMDLHYVRSQHSPAKAAWRIDTNFQYSHICTLAYADRICPPCTSLYKQNAVSFELQIRQYHVQSHNVKSAFRAINSTANVQLFDNTIDFIYQCDIRGPLWRSFLRLDVCSNFVITELFRLVLYWIDL